MTDEAKRALWRIELIALIIWLDVARSSFERGLAGLAIFVTIGMDWFRTWQRFRLLKRSVRPTNEEP